VMVDDFDPRGMVYINHSGAFLLKWDDVPGGRMILFLCLFL